MDAVDEQNVPLAPVEAGVEMDRIGLLHQVGVDRQDRLPPQDAVEQDVQLLGASVEKSRHPEAHFRRQRRGRQRSDDAAEKPKPQVEGPASEDHPGERVGRVPAAT